MTRQFTSYADVTAALNAPELSERGAGIDGVADRAALHAEAARALSAEGLTALSEDMQRSALHVARQLPPGEPVDLLQLYARPWCARLALRMIDTGRLDDAPLLQLAGEVFRTAALATSRQGVGGASAAVGALARALAGPRSTALTVQAFVALSQTLPLTLVAAWHVLASQPGAWRALRADRAALPLAVEELLRLASPARAVFRRALRTVVIGETQLSAGDEVILMLDAANHDPARFPDPLRYDLQRGGGGHVGLGRGMHPCAGAAIVRLALGVATSALLDVAEDITLAAPVTWLDGFAIRAPTSLRIVLQPGT